MTQAIGHEQNKGIIMEKLAYPKIGKLAAIILHKVKYKNSRIQWIQQAMSDMDFSKLK